MKKATKNQILGKRKIEVILCDPNKSEIVGNKHVKVDNTETKFDPILRNSNYSSCNLSYESGSDKENPNLISKEISSPKNSKFCRSILTNATNATQDYDSNNSVKSEIVNSIKGSDDFERILASTPLKTKLSHLLAKEIPMFIGFKLPNHCNELLKTFEMFELTIRDLLLLKKPLHWESIKEACAISYKRTIEIESIQRIIYCVPYLYQFSYETNPSNSNRELKIDIISEEKERKERGNFSVYQRKEDYEFRIVILRRELEGYVKKIHSICLKKLNAIHQLEVFENEGKWHPKFERQLNKVPLVPLSPLPKDMNEKRPMRVDLLLMGEEKQKKYEKFEETMKDYHDEDLSVEKSRNRNQYGLSNKFLLLIREKQKLFEEYKIQNQNSLIEDPENLRAICEAIKVYYSMRNVSSMFLSNVVEYLKKDSNNLRLPIESLIDCINQVCLLNPNWLSQVDCKLGKILKLNKTYPFCQVLSRIFETESIFKEKS